VCPEIEGENIMEHGRL